MLKVTNANTTPELWAYGEVGFDFTADDFRRELADIPSGKSILLRINSPGGSYIDGIAIHAQLARRTGGVDITVDGEAASAGSIIAMAGTTIDMASGSWMMIHEVRGTILSATADELREAMERIEATNTDLVRIYSRRWKGSEKELRAALAAETWFTAEAAIEAGLADTINSNMKMAACASLDKFSYRNIPEKRAEVQGKALPRHQEAAQVIERIFAGYK
jgi:ATP-dependent protease ClpP protease subunit